MPPPRHRAGVRPRHRSSRRRRIGAFAEENHLDHRPSRLRRGRSHRAGQTPKKAAIAAWIGSALEYYDFFIYGTAAALVFPQDLLPRGQPDRRDHRFVRHLRGRLRRPPDRRLLHGPHRRQARPQDGADRHAAADGRLDVPRSAACRPTTRSASLAPILLVVLRLLQGLSAAGEQAGANSMSLEHAPADRRGFFTSFTLSGTQGGQILATAVFLPIAARCPRSSCCPGAGGSRSCSAPSSSSSASCIRRTLRGDARRSRRRRPRRGRQAAPLAMLFRDHWRDVLRVICRRARRGGQHDLRRLRPVATRSNDGRASARPTMLWVAIVANVVALVRHPALGDAVRPHRPQAGVHRRRAGLRRADVRLPVGDRQRQTTR